MKTFLVETPLKSVMVWSGLFLIPFVRQCKTSNIPASMVLIPLIIALLKKGSLFYRKQVKAVATFQKVSLDYDNGNIIIGCLQ